MFECLSALRGDSFKKEYPSLKRFVKLKEEEENQEVEEADDHYDDDDYELFSIELQRGACGVGLALIDTRVSERAVCIFSFKDYVSWTKS